MRILHLVSTGERRGAETFASDLIGSMNRDGVSQRVIVLYGDGPPAVHFDAPVTTLGCNGSTVPLVRVDWRGVRRLRRHLRLWRPDIVQAHGGASLKYATMAGAGRHERIVFRSIGLAPRWIRHGPRRLAYTYLLRKTARVVAVADRVRRELIDTFRVPEQRVVTIPNAIDARRLMPNRGREATRRALGISPDHRVLISVGALTWEKDPLAHLELSARIMEARSDVIHVIAGDGPMRQELEKAITLRGLQGRVLLLGSRDDVPDLLLAADIALFASRPDGMEGMPGIIIEAGMVGRPVVGYAVAGVDEVILDGRTGLLVPPGDQDRLTDVTLRLIDDGELRARLGTAARQHCCERFEIKSISDRYLALYMELMG